jgi:hypothetical protein
MELVGEGPVWAASKNWGKKAMQNVSPYIQLSCIKTRDRLSILRPFSPAELSLNPPELQLHRIEMARAESQGNGIIVT